MNSEYILQANPLAQYLAHREEIDLAIQRTLHDGRYILGEQTRAFDQEFATFIGVSHAIGVASGTDALVLAFRACSIGPGDEVVTTPHTAVATVAAIELVGATPVLADVELNTCLLSAKEVEARISARTKAVVPVHLFGQPVSLDLFAEVCRKHKLFLIEDCAQAHGATYKGRPVGCLGDAAAFSFCQDKIMSTGGEGGMLTTNDDELWQRAWSFKDHGKDHGAAYKHKQQTSSEFRWLHHSFGTNWRLTEMQAAIGRCLLAKLPSQLELRRRNASILNQQFGILPALRVTIPPEEIGHAYYKYYVFLRPEWLRDGWGRDRLLQAVVAEGIPCFSGSCSEIYLEKAFPENMRPAQRLQVARQLGETSLMFLVHPTLSEQDMLDTARAVEKVLKIASVQLSEALAS